MEESEDQLRASGAHVMTECWRVYLVPARKDDPRVPGRLTSFVTNNKEVIMCALPSRTLAKVVQRAEFNSCGELLTASTT